MLMQRVWQTAYNGIFRVRQVLTYDRTRVVRALHAALSAEAVEIRLVKELGNGFTTAVRFPVVKAIYIFATTSRSEISPTRRATYK
jgi:hypothetical protein